MTSAAWIVVISGIAVLATVALFVTGLLYARPVVARMQQTHDKDLDRMIAEHDKALLRAIQDGDYYRAAAQSCALANAHLDGQLRTVTALLEQCRKGT